MFSEITSIKWGTKAFVIQPDKNV